MKRIIALVAALFVSVAGAQTVQTTPNLITSGASHTWYGLTTGSIPAGCATAGPCPGGPQPIYDPATNMISFSYNANASVGQTMAINQALANAGAGVKINGYSYSYDVRNMNGDNRQGGTDTLTVSQLLRGPANSVLLSSSQYYNTKFEWQTVTGTKTATTPYNISDTSYLQFGIQGGDNGYWGGYFGPQVRNVSMSLNYTVDPCATNPAYSPSCANYNTVSTSNNLVPNPTGYAVLGSSIDQSYAINQALALSGSNVMIHGFQWGYQANANGPYCNSWDWGFLGCWDYRTPIVTTNVSITDNNNNNIYQVTRDYQNSYTTTNYQYLFPSSRNLATMGNFNFTATTNDVAYIGDMWSRAMYTPDPCTVNPLSSASCPGYQQAYQEQQCSANPLYATVCPGYAAAYLTQQCSANVFYSPSCPGYAQAYHNQQCSISPLYASDCPGYDQAYLTQQCSRNSLYSTQCTGYAEAYKTQQCTLNPLYATDCPGYDQAYLNAQCIRDSLYSKLCEGYKTAYAIKYLAPLDPAVTTAVNQQLTTTVEVAKADPANVVSATGSSATDSVLTTPSTTSATSVTSVTSVIAPPPNTATSTAASSAAAPPPPPPPSAERAAEGKKTEGAVASVEKKAGGNAANAKAAATERAKELANEAGKAATMEAQAATQGLVVGLMGYVPGFSAYQNSIVPDTMANAVARQYHKPTIDNRNAQRRLSGASEVRWQEMVDSQYNLGK